uniref:Uncharacterized protein n=1 Tax=Kwoniella dejecticola CBS 10117 TaxID=1296121 RepID=A0A1A6A448_9TREE|nr:uncharacterized protein I303_04152 [Kwoniella dejecticola CBS 10117]OBR84831.1 hypothetical protein I303_04152 [Kwoniella dejecticola CBS 10117]
MVALKLYTFLLLVLAFTASASPVVNRRVATNAARFARGLPPLKPARNFDPTRVRRQQQSGIP